MADESAGGAATEQECAPVNARLDFFSALHKLETDPGVSADEIEDIKAALLSMVTAEEDG